MQYGFKSPGSPLEIKEVEEINLALIMNEVEGFVECLTNPFDNDLELQMYMNEEPHSEDKANFNFCNANRGLLVIYGNVVFLRFKQGAEQPEGLSDSQIQLLKEMKELN